MCGCSKPVAICWRHHQFTSIFLAAALLQAHSFENGTEKNLQRGTRAFPDFCRGATKLWYLQFRGGGGGLATFIKMHHPVAAQSLKIAQNVSFRSKFIISSFFQILEFWRENSNIFQLECKRSHSRQMRLFEGFSNPVCKLFLPPT